MALDSSAETGRPAIAGWRWGIIWLLFLATLINYMDRQTLGSTARYIKDEFGLTEAGYGWVEFWFIISYGLFQIPAGFLADRLALRWLYPCALLLWSAAGFLTGLADTVVMLSACRLMLGMAEAFNWPCAVAIVRRVMPLEARALANGIFHSGASVGAILTPLLVLVLVGERAANWRLLFQVVGGLGLLWALLWMWSIHGERAAAIARPAEAGETTSLAVTIRDFSGVFRLRQFWITLTVGITVNICWHFYRVWLPRFLDRDLQFAQDHIQLVLMGFYVAADLGSMGAGYLTRRLTLAGRSVARARKLVLLLAALLCTLSTPAALFLSPWLTLPLLFLVAMGAMGGFPIYFALNQETAPRHAALCLGITGSVSLLSIGALNPPIGQLVDRLGTFVPSLIAVGFVPLLGALVALLWPEEEKA